MLSKKNQRSVNTRFGRKSDIGFYLLCILSFWLFTFVTLNFWLKPYAIFYEQSGKMTFGYLAYAVIGMFFLHQRNHYGDSFIGFSINIVVWSFALAALYKTTKSVMVCAVYHAFVDAVGAVYDWNALFDSFPGDIGVNL